MYRRILGPVIAAVALCLGACSEPSDEARLSKAQAALSKYDYASATIELKSYLQRKPSDGEARVMLGRALLGQGDAQAAAIEFEKAQQMSSVDQDVLTPLLARAWVGSGKSREVVQQFGKVKLASKSAQDDLRLQLATAYLRLGRTKEGEAALQEVLASNPDHPGALLLQAKLAAAARRFDEALSLAQRSVREGIPSGDAHRLRADILVGVKNDFEGALKELELATQDRAHEAAARASLVGVLAEHNRPDEARAQLALLQKRYAGSAGTLYAEAYLALRTGDLEKAKSLAEGLVRSFGSNARVLLLGGTIDLRRGEYTSAASKLSRAVEASGPASLGARVMLADAYLGMGDAERALVSLRPLLDAHVMHPDVLSRAGQAFLLKGDVASAESAYVQAARSRPDDASLATHLALFDLARGQTEKGFATLKEIAAKDSGVVADMAAISAYLRRDDFDGALAAIAGLQAKQPTRPIASHLRGEALRSKGDRAGARAAYTEALRLDPGYVASAIALAMMDVDDRDFDAARKRLDTLVKANPKHVGAQLLRLRVMATQGIGADALKAAIDEAVRNNPSDPATRVYQIEVLTQLRDSAGALSAAQAAQAALPDSPVVVDALGLAYLDRRDLTLAASTFDRLKTLMPRSALPYLRLAELHQRQGNLVALRQDLSQALELEPGSADLRRRLLLMARSDSGAEFVGGLARRLQKNPPLAATGLVLEGDVAVARKRLDAALATYRAALARAPTDGQIAARVFDALAAQGKAAEARAFAADWSKSQPAAVDFVEHIAQKAMMAGDVGGAEKWLVLLVQRAPNNGSAWNNLALVQARRGAAESVGSAERALTLLPGQPAVLDTYASALASQKRLPEAIAVQKRAVAAASGAPALRLALAELYLRADDRASAIAELDALAALGDRFPAQARVAELRRQAGGR